MIPKALADINEQDFQELIANKVAEGKTLEYKSALPGASDAEKVKFLRIVTSFANTVGGDLLYGMQASSGIPTAAIGLQGINEDQEKLRLESLCLNGTQPRLTGVQYRFIPTKSGGPVLLVRVVQSWNLPHRVTLGGHSQFYGRNAAGSYPLDVGELRNLFTASETQAERIRAFRADRLIKIAANEGSVPLGEGAKLVLHVVPMSTFSVGELVDVVGKQALLRTVGVIGASGHSFGINLDGFFTYSPSAEASHSFGYTLFFRNGAIEAVGIVGATSYTSQDPIIPSLAYEQETTEFLPQLLGALDRLGVAPPAYVFLSLLGVRGYRFAVHPRLYMRGPGTSDRNDLILPELLIQNFNVQPHQALKPLFDMVWNAFGLARSYNYDEEGNWSPQR
jgi:hypothetical protein